MAPETLPVQTTRVFIICAFLIVILYYNYLLLRESLDVIFWATTVAFPIIFFKAATNFEFIASSRSIIFDSKLILGMLLAYGVKSLLLEYNIQLFLNLVLAAVIVLIEKAGPAQRNRFKVLRSSLTIFLLLSCSYSLMKSIIEEFKVIPQALLANKWISDANALYIQQQVSIYSDSLLDYLKQFENLFLGLEKCNIKLDTESLSFSSLRNINVHEIYGALKCVAIAHQLEIVRIFENIRPYAISAMARVLSFTATSLSLISNFVTFSSTAFVMSSQSITPLHFMETVLELIDDSGFLATEFRTLFKDILEYNSKNFLLSCFSTFIVFSLFSLEIKVIPTILSGLMTVIPAVSPSSVLLFGLFELLFKKTNPWIVAAFILLYLQISSYCRNLANDGVSTLNRKEPDSNILSFTFI